MNKLRNFVNVAVSQTCSPIANITADVMGNALVVNASIAFNEQPRHIISNVIRAQESMVLAC